MILRPATPADLPTLLRFEQGIIAAERPFDPTLSPDPIHYYDLAALINSPEAAVLVAEVEGVVVASGHARIRQAKPYEQMASYTFLGFMWVEPAFRGQGINSVLMEGLADWARREGFTELRLHVYADNQAALRAYDKAGFQQHLVEMRRPL